MITYPLPFSSHESYSKFIYMPIDKIDYTYLLVQTYFKPSHVLVPWHVHLKFIRRKIKIYDRYM
jgi:hypothetical protein